MSATIAILAFATGQYPKGKVLVGPALGALARKLAQRAALAAEAAADKLAAEQAADEADKIAAYKAKQASPEGQAEQTARAAKK